MVPDGDAARTPAAYFIAESICRKAWTSACTCSRAPAAASDLPPGPAWLQPRITQDRDAVTAAAVFARRQLPGTLRDRGGRGRCSCDRTGRCRLP